MIPIKTYTGRTIDLENFKKEDIDLRDIAFSLSRQRRYAGHTAVPWTVGQHIVLCAMIADICEYTQDQIKLCFLHDIEETWVQDVIYPIKNNLMLGKYKGISHLVSNVVMDFFGMKEQWAEVENKKIVDAIDQVAFILESMHMVPLFDVNDYTFNDLTLSVLDHIVKELDFSIPHQLIEMSDNDVAQAILELLSVSHIEGQTDEK